MGCNCDKGIKYRVTKDDGKQVTVNSLAQAKAVVASFGGTYVRV